MKLTQKTVKFLFEIKIPTISNFQSSLKNHNTSKSHKSQKHSENSCKHFICASHAEANLYPSHESFTRRKKFIP